MNKEIREVLKEALDKLNKENIELLKEGKYSQMHNNASTISAIAEALSNYYSTNI